jgi:hypothetical protein
MRTWDILCKRLATIETNAELSISLNEVEYKGFDRESLNQFYRDVEFRGMIRATETKQQAIDIIDATSIYQLDDVLVSPTLPLWSSVWKTITIKPQSLD